MENAVKPELNGIPLPDVFTATSHHDALTTTQTIHNFSAGPCILPQSVMQQASDAVRELDGSGLSLIEISHRSKAFVDVMEEARSAGALGIEPARPLRSALPAGRRQPRLPDHGHELHPGRQQHGLRGDRHLGEESIEVKLKKMGTAQAITSSEETGFDRIPALPATSDAGAVHITTNNTIFGTQYKGDPPSTRPWWRT